MNQIFNITRFSRLAMYDARTNYKKYLIAVAIGFVGIFLLTIFFFSVAISTETWTDGSTFESRLIQDNFQVTGAPAGITFLFCLTAFFPIFLLLSFPALSGKKSTMNYLLLPASVFEKYLLEFFIRVVLGFIALLLIFYSMAYLATIIYEAHLNFRFADIVERHQHSIYIERGTLNANFIEIQSDSDAIIVAMKRFMVIFWITICLCMFSVRTFFNRFSFVKTGAIIYAGTFFFIYLLATIGIGSAYKHSETVLWIANSALILTAIVCLILGYYNLKRKRI